MSQVNVSLPDDLSAWAESRAIEARLGSAGAYMAKLLRRDRHDAEKRARLLAAIDEGLLSGVSERDPFEYLDELRAGLRGAAGSVDAALG